MSCLAESCPNVLVPCLGGPVGHVYVCVWTMCFDDELLSLYIKMKLNEAKTRPNYFVDWAIIIATISFWLKELMLHH